jgi:uncharacterized protein YozE (UPF0346 family)
MFYEGDAWLSESEKGSDRKRPTSQKQLAFAASAFQGVYNVTQFVLEDIGAGSMPLQLRGYANPIRGVPYPGMWLLTLNHFGFLPVELLGPEKHWSLINPTKSLPWFRPNPRAASRSLFEPDRVPPRAWLNTVYLLSLGIATLGFVFLRCNLSRSGAKPMWLLLSDNVSSRLSALCGACLSASALIWILGLPWCIPMSILISKEEPRLQILKVVLLLGFATPLIVLLNAIFRAFVQKLFTTPITFLNRLLAATYFLLPVLTFGGVMAVWWYSCTQGDDAPFFRLRSLELYSGSSPALPFALVCGTFFCLSVFHLKQYALAGSARPRLNIRIDERKPSAYRKAFKDTYDSIEERIASPWGHTTEGINVEDRLIGTVRSYRLLVSSLFVASCALVLFHSIRPFEHLNYTLCLECCVFVIVLCIAAKWYDMLMLWGKVNKLLKLIQILPLGPAFERVAKDWPGGAIWNFTRSVSNEAVQREMLYVLHRRALFLQHAGEEERERVARTQRVKAAAASSDSGSVLLLQIASGHEVDRTGTGEHGSDEFHTSAPESVAARRAQRQYKEFTELVWGPAKESKKPPFRNILAGEPSPGVQTLSCMKKQRDMAARVANEIYEDDLVPAWQSSTQYDESQYLRDCADFVALHFCRFVAYAVDQVRRMAVTLSVTLVFLILIFHSYRPEGPELTSKFLVGLFLGVGYAVWRVFSQMERNVILSTIAHSKAGELNAEFWTQILALGGLPLLGLIAHLFPAISQFLFHWVAPGLQGAH